VAHQRPFLGQLLAFLRPCLSFFRERRSSRSLTTCAPGVWAACPPWPAQIKALVRRCHDAAAPRLAHCLAITQDCDFLGRWHQPTPLPLWRGALKLKEISLHPIGKAGTQPAK